MSDKLMRDHVLLQTSPGQSTYEDEEGRKKPRASFSICRHLRQPGKALSFDSSDITGVVQHRMLERRVHKYDGGGPEQLPRGPRRQIRGQQVEQSSTTSSTRAAEKFYTFFRNLQDLYEILSPSDFLRPSIKEFETLAEMYQVIRANYEPGIPVSRELLRKTIALVQEQTKGGPILPPTAVQEINEQTLEELEKRKRSPRGKVFDLRRGIGELVLKKGLQTPFLVSIGERAEAVIARYLQRQIDTRKRSWS